MRTFLSILAFIFSIIYGLFINPHILCNMWEWFVVPMGVSNITHWQALGLLISLGFLKMTFKLEFSTFETDVKESLKKIVGLLEDKDSPKEEESWENILNGDTRKKREKKALELQKKLDEKSDRVLIKAFTFYVSVLIIWVVTYLVHLGV